MTHGTAMKGARTVAAMLSLSLAPLLAPAQEVGYMDLTDTVFRERSRPPRTGRASCSDTPLTTQESQSEVTVTIVWLDKLRYRMGEQATFEIKVLNSGKETILVPWTPHLGDFEPADARSSYKYRVGSIMLNFKDPKDSQFNISEPLYGSANVPGSLRELAPGQWFTVKGRQKVGLYEQSWIRKEFGDSEFVVAKVRGFYTQRSEAYSPEDGGSEIHSCIQLPSRKGNQLDVILER
jgi:hypothetical protein